MTVITYSRMVHRSLEAAELLAKKVAECRGDRSADAEAARHGHDRGFGQEDRPSRRSDGGLSDELPSSVRLRPGFRKSCSTGSMPR